MVLWRWKDSPFGGPGQQRIGCFLWDRLWSKIGAMASLLQLTVAPATQDQFNELDANVGQSMMQAGGPPAGLMSHAVYPDGDGFVIAEVWRAESEGQSYIDDVLSPLLAEVGLTARSTVVRPVWSFARP